MSDIKKDFENLRDHLSTSGPYIEPSVILTSLQAKRVEAKMIELTERAEKAEAERDQLKADLAGRENILDVMSEEILSRPPEGKLDWLREQARKWMVIPREGVGR